MPDQSGTMTGCGGTVWSGYVSCTEGQVPGSVLKYPGLERHLEDFQCQWPAVSPSVFEICFTAMATRISSLSLDRPH